jgi:hypothetical protein
MKKAKATKRKPIQKSASKSTKQTKTLTKSSTKSTAKKQTVKSVAKSPAKITTKVISKTPAKVQSKAKASSPSSEKTVKSVQTGIQILNYATKNKTSISEAARKSGFGRNYVSDVKARIDSNFKKKSITRELYDSFKNSSKNYNNSSKK